MNKVGYYKTNENKLKLAETFDNVKHLITSMWQLINCYIIQTEVKGNCWVNGYTSYVTFHYKDFNTNKKTERSLNFNAIYNLHMDKKLKDYSLRMIEDFIKETAI